MIIQEGFSVNHRDYIHTYSNENYYILDENGNKYVDAFDAPEFIKQYLESDELIIDNLDSEHLTSSQLIKEFQKIEQHTEKLNEINENSVIQENRINLNSSEIQSQKIEIQSQKIEIQSQKVEIQSQSETANDLVDAVAELGELAADNNINSEDLMDAITELADLVAQILEGE